MKKYLLILLISLSWISCKKESASKSADAVCYVCENQQGESLLIVCGHNEDEAFQQLQDSATCLNGICPPTRDQFRQFCHQR